jgi:hypothetical protein
MAKTFRGARLKIGRANQHINDLYLQSREFAKTGPYSVFVEADPETGDSVLRISMDQPAPEGVLLIVGDALHNLRSALDFAMSDIEFETTGIRDPHTTFPMRNTRNELVTAVNGGLKKKAPKAVIDHIVKVVQPYKGGNADPLWSLHALDIEDKHRLLIAKNDVTYIRNIHCKDGRGQYFVIPEWAIIYPRSTRYRCVGRKDVQVANKGRASFGIVFGDGMPLYGKPILPALTNLSNFVSETVDGLERVFHASRIP